MNETCVACGVLLTEANWSEAAWIEWLQHRCQPCLDALTITVPCAGCATEMTGIPDMDWWTFDGRNGGIDHVCNQCQSDAEAQYAEDMAARGPQL